MADEDEKVDYSARARVINLIVIAIIYLTRVGEVVDLRRVEKNRKMENGKTGRFNLKYTEKKETEI